MSTELCARAGFDWVMLEQQHWVWDWAKFQHALVAILLGGATPFVRVSHNDYAEIGQALDAGMLGVVVSMIDTPEDARRAGQAVRLPPRGTRSLGATHATRYGGDYAAWCNDQILLMVQIESAAAVQHCAAILGDPNVDGCWIGPGDLAVSLGMAPSEARKGHPDQEQAYGRVLAACRETGKFSGISCSDGEEAAKRIRQGFQFVSTGNDTRRVRKGAARDLQIARAAAG
ncbi:MAG: 2,4-dihydroxyhept-2-ene-1,7-dioic acid aldolase [Actinobacteria bacterium]|nr:2,4-dihydroxyhept-2-ene-1,7-dioic acid aldolase [Actinomycetota bacterium]